MRQVKGLITERALGMDVTYTAVDAEVDAPLHRDATLGLNHVDGNGLRPRLRHEVGRDGRRRDLLQRHFESYRALSVDYADGGFVHDVVRQGPVVAGVFRF